MHFDHIRETVQQTFKESGYQLDKSDAVLEPSYICEALGVQGRLDYMQRNMKSFIEMKSGKADEYALKGRVEPKENNRVQMTVAVHLDSHYTLISKLNIRSSSFRSCKPIHCRQVPRGQGYPMA